MNAHRYLAFVLLASQGAAQVFASAVEIDLDPTAVLGPVERVAVGDLNRDGHPDLVAQRATELQVALGDGAGGFATLAPVSIGDLVLSLQLGDVTGDQVLDVVLGAFPSGVLVLAGDGSGGLLPSTSLGGGSAAQVVLDDANGDGVADLLQASGSALVVRQGMLAGGFGAASSSSVAGSGLGDLAFGDVTGDGVGDVVVAALLGDSRLLVGDGAGGFVDQGAVAAPGRRLALEHVDADALLDLCYVSALDGALYWCRSLGGGAFAAPGLIAQDVDDYELVDLDGDGRLDVIVADAGTAGVRWLAGNGGGSFGVPQLLSAPPSAHVAVADLDYDGRADLVCAGLRASNAAVLGNALGSPPGTGRYGSGTPGCRGRMGLTGNVSPREGEVSFRVLCTNAPRRQFGFITFGPPDQIGSDPFGFGLLLHVNVLSAFTVTDVLRSDLAGNASFAFPIPSGGFVGTSAGLQAVWFAQTQRGDTCSPSFADAVSSVGLLVTVQP